MPAFILAQINNSSSIFTALSLYSDSHLVFAVVPDVYHDGVSVREVLLLAPLPQTLHLLGTLVLAPHVTSLHVAQQQLRLVKPAVEIT